MDELHAPGTLFHRPDGLSGCNECGWFGIATRLGGYRVGRALRHLPGFRPGSKIVGSTRQDVCPACGIDVHAELRADMRIVEKVPRNAPCPCGSERKYKKCCGA